MKFRQYLNESDDIYSIIDSIKRDCKPFLKEFMPIFKKWNGFLYRGMDEMDDFGKKNVRKNRIPMSTNPIIHKQIDNMMYKVHKIHGRSNSIFCTFDVDLAQGYGHPCMIFPIGQYKYLWSPKIGDLYINLQKTDDFMMEVDYKYKMAFIHAKNADNPEEETQKVQANKDAVIANNTAIIRKKVQQYQSTNMVKASNTDNEIMVSCKSYYYISTVMEDTVTDIFNNL